MAMNYGMAQRLSSLVFRDYVRGSASDRKTQDFLSVAFMSENTRQQFLSGFIAHNDKKTANEIKKKIEKNQEKIYKLDLAIARAHKSYDNALVRLGNEEEVSESRTQADFAALKEKFDAKIQGIENKISSVMADNAILQHIMDNGLEKDFLFASPCEFVRYLQSAEGSFAFATITIALRLAYHIAATASVREDKTRKNAEAKTARVLAITASAEAMAEKEASNENTENTVDINDFSDKYVAEYSKMIDSTVEFSGSSARSRLESIVFNRTGKAPSEIAAILIDEAVLSLGSWYNRHWDDGKINFSGMIFSADTEKTADINELGEEIISYKYTNEKLIDDVNADSASDCLEFASHKMHFGLQIWPDLSDEKPVLDSNGVQKKDKNGNNITYYITPIRRCWDRINELFHQFYIVDSGEAIYYAPKSIDTTAFLDADGNSTPLADTIISQADFSGDISVLLDYKQEKKEQERRYKKLFLELLKAVYPKKKKDGKTAYLLKLARIYKGFFKEYFISNPYNPDVLMPDMARLQPIFNRLRYIVTVGGNVPEMPYRTAFKSDEEYNIAIADYEEKMDIWHARTRLAAEVSSVFGNNIRRRKEEAVNRDVRIKNELKTLENQSASTLLAEKVLNFSAKKLSNITLAAEGAKALISTVERDKKFGVNAAFNLCKYRAETGKYVPAQAIKALSATQKQSITKLIKAVKADSNKKKAFSKEVDDSLVAKFRAVKK